MNNRSEPMTPRLALSGNTIQHQHPKKTHQIRNYSDIFSGGALLIDDLSCKSQSVIGKDDPPSNDEVCCKAR